MYIKPGKMSKLQSLTKVGTWRYQCLRYPELTSTFNTGLPLIIHLKIP